jgi:hypothetical protein
MKKQKITKEKLERMRKHKPVLLGYEIDVLGMAESIYGEGLLLKKVYGYKTKKDAEKSYKELNEIIDKVRHDTKRWKW